ncbi:MAG TPA: MmgE/PrpD family protein [Burkholderiales bacterium]|nr:MmgE/PrpD family protein [Burkholderiales bacterium]
MSPTLELARFVKETRDDEIPADVLGHAKHCVLNLLGVALHATRDDAARIVLDLIEEEGGHPQASVLGFGAKTTVQNAALANGLLAHLDDFDDTFLPTVFHPSAPTIPAALALAEQRRASGRDFLVACTLGLEVACRIAHLVQAVRHGAVWHMTGMVGPFGAAAASARLLGLDGDATARAFGLAGTQGSGLRETFGTMTKAFHPGRAAQSGLLAARMAARGFTSSTSILEGEHGFVKALAPGAALDAATEGLKDRWFLLDNAFKPYACGILAHAMVDAMRALRQKPGVSADRISSVTGRVNPLAITLESRPDPDSGLESRLSFQHAMAAALIDGAAYPEQFTDARASDAQVARLRSKIAVTGDAGIAQDACEITVTLDDGRSYTERVAHATGTLENPMRGPRLEEKFRALTAGVLPPARAGEVIDAVARLETLYEAGTLAALCTTK